MKSKIFIYLLTFVMMIGLVSAYNGDYCNRTNTPCSLTGDGVTICTSTDLSYMYIGYDFITDTNDVGNISGWDTSCITDVSALFQNSNFNQNINSWDVSNINIFSNMFYGDSDYNKPLDNWITTSATNMQVMFQFATAFNQDISNWDYSNILYFTDFLSNSGISILNYDKLLVSWSGQILQNLVDTGVSQQYTNYTAHNIVTNIYNWTINDLGYTCVENWVSNDTICNGVNYTIQYYDSNMCNTTYTLPIDNGTIANCSLNCTPTWITNDTSCNGYNYTIQYYDLFNCNSTSGLPIDNGTIENCTINCNWTLQPQPCTNNVRLQLYTSNATFCTEPIPSNNGTYVDCTTIIINQVQRPDYFLPFLFLFVALVLCTVLGFWRPVVFYVGAMICGMFFALCIYYKLDIVAILISLFMVPVYVLIAIVFSKMKN